MKRPILTKSCYETSVCAYKISGENTVWRKEENKIAMTQPDAFFSTGGIFIIHFLPSKNLSASWLYTVRRE
jgi:hypothetical protein